MICAILIVLIEPFSLTFWGIYICCGISDFLDGFIARRLQCESELGAKLDSMADAICILAIISVVLPVVEIPAWLWGMIVVIASIRLVAYIVGFIKYHTFTSIHTYLNKVVGGMLFIIPVLYSMYGIHVTGIIVCMSALVSAVEELMIISLSRQLNRNCKSILNRESTNK